MPKVIIVLGGGSSLRREDVRDNLEPLALGNELWVLTTEELSLHASELEDTAHAIAAHAYRRYAPELCIGIWGGNQPLLCPNGDLSEPTHHELAYVIQEGEEFAGAILSPCDGTGCMRVEYDGTGTYLPAEDPLPEEPPPENALAALTGLVHALYAEIALQAPQGQLQMQ